MKIFLTGHKGLVGSAILRKLKEKNFKNIITIDRKKLDLLNQKSVYNFLKKKKPDLVINAAGRVGGILDNNTRGAEFIYQNSQMQNNIIHGSYLNKIKKLIFLGSSCIYPKYSKQPIKEDYLLTGKLEETNEPYAVAKISGIKMCESYNKQYKTNYLCLMPTNLYGPNDNFSENDSHVIPGLIARMHKAKIEKDKSFNVWGTGKPLREFLHSEDLANAIWFVIKNEIEENLINIGSGIEITIKDLVKKIQLTIGYNGDVKFDTTKPDGNPRKLLDSSKIFQYGWKPEINLDEGLESTYKWYLKNY